MHVVQNLLLLLLLTSLGHQALGSEIIKGTKVNKNSMLYMASVQSRYGHVCGGFLISKDFVMTAAHCDDRNPVTSVVLGTHNLDEINEDTMRYGIEKCKPSSYTNASLGNDIMLLRLSREARNEKNKLIQHVDLSTIKKNVMCNVAGWGMTKTNGRTVSELRVAKVPIINLKTCQKLWHNTLPANVICAGGYGSKTGFCQGDSGGPLICGNKAVGVVSFNSGYNCVYPDNVPNVYTDVYKYLPWIQETLKKKRC